MKLKPPFLLLVVFFAFSFCNSDSRNNKNLNDSTPLATEKVAIPEYPILCYSDLGFYAGFPGEPSKTEDGGITMFNYVEGTEAFFIGVSDTGGKKVDLDAALGFAASTIQNIDTISYGEVKTKEGIVGKELVVIGKLPSMSAYFAGQVFVHNGKMYQLSVITNGENPPIERITAFWDAFSLD